MAETSGFWTTSGTPAGHQVASYTQVIAAKAWAIIAACGGKEGVAPNFLNELAGSVPGANTALIATGGGVVDGQWYENGANVDVTIPSAVGGGNTRIDRIVLRVTWANFECEITRIAGTDAASPTAPAITQTPGTTYDIKLYQALVNTSGTVTLTDERIWASDSIVYRRGGHASNWPSPGSTNYRPGKFIMQTGAVSFGSIAPGSFSNQVVTYPRPFSNGQEIVFANAILSNINVATVPGVTNVVIYAYNNGSTSYSPTVIWLAIGPE